MLANMLAHQHPVTEAYHHNNSVTQSKFALVPSQQYIEFVYEWNAINYVISGIKHTEYDTYTSHQPLHKTLRTQYLET